MHCRLYPFYFYFPLFTNVKAYRTLVTRSHIVKDSEPHIIGTSEESLSLNFRSSFGAPAELLRSSSGAPTELLRSSCGAHPELLRSSFGAPPELLRSSSGAPPELLRSSCGAHPELLRRFYGDRPVILYVVYSIRVARRLALPAALFTVGLIGDLKHFPALLRSF